MNPGDLPALRLGVFELELVRRDGVEELLERSVLVDRFHPHLNRLRRHLMSYSVHILRQTEEGQEVPITLDEWNAYVDADSDLVRFEPGHPHHSEKLVFLRSDSTSPDEWQWLQWVTGSLSSDYPQQPMLKKMGQIARHFDAIVMSDDGDIWAIDESGKVTMDGC